MSRKRKLANSLVEEDVPGIPVTVHSLVMIPSMLPCWHAVVSRNEFHALLLKPSIDRYVYVEAETIFDRKQPITMQVVRIQPRHLALGQLVPLEQDESAWDAKMWSLLTPTDAARIWTLEKEKTRTHTIHTLLSLYGFPVGLPNMVMSYLTDPPLVFLKPCSLKGVSNSPAMQTQLDVHTGAIFVSDLTPIQQLLDSTSEIPIKLSVGMTLPSCLWYFQYSLDDQGFTNFRLCPSLSIL